MQIPQLDKSYTNILTDLCNAMKKRPTKFRRIGTLKLDPKAPEP